MPTWLDLTFQLCVFLCDGILIGVLTSTMSKKHVTWLLLSLFALLAVFAEDIFHLMRLISWVLFLHLPLAALLSAFVLRKRNRVASALLGALAAICTLVALDAFLIEPHALELNRHRLELPHLNRPLKLAVVADLQTDHVGAYEREVLEKVLAEKPDLILLPGDFIQLDGPSEREELRRLRELLLNLDFGAPQGAFAVRGNVDSAAWKSAFEGTRVTPLEKTTRLQPRDDITLIGLDLESSFQDTLALKRFDLSAHIVFGHAPDFALGAVNADLLVAGHTHGGQVQFPLLGPLLTLSAVPRAWAAGITHRGDGYLLVSRGVGMERGNAPRLRFLCRPELVILELIPRTETIIPR